MAEYSPLVFVIVPTCDRSVLLRRALDSLLRQTYSNWRAVVVANGCADDTAEVLRSYASDPRFIVRVVPESLGGATARNLGLSLVSGSVVAFLDDDDEWRQDKLEKQLALFASCPEASIVTCDYIEITNKWRRPIRRSKVISYTDMLSYNCVGGFSCGMVRGQDVAEHRIDPMLHAGQDWDLWLKIMRSTGRPALNCPEPLVSYYCHGSDRLSAQLRRVYKSNVRILRGIWSELDKRQRLYGLTRLRLIKMNYAGASRLWLLRTIPRHFYVYLFCCPKRDLQALYSYALKPMLRALGVDAILSATVSATYALVKGRRRGRSESDL